MTGSLPPRLCQLVDDLRALGAVVQPADALAVLEALVDVDGST